VLARAPLGPATSGAPFARRAVRDTSDGLSKDQIACERDAESGDIHIATNVWSGLSAI